MIRRAFSRYGGIPIRGNHMPQEAHIAPMIPAKRMNDTRTITMLWNNEYGPDQKAA